LSLALLKPPGQHQRHADLEQLARLDDHPQVNPALGALLGDAGQRDGHQQHHTSGVERRRKNHQALRRNLRHDKQQRQSNQHVAPMVGKAGAVVVPRGIHSQQACTCQNQHQQQQPAVKATKQWQDASQQCRLVDRGFHGT
jgi:hypothetical protein